jgi:hypothetical protein
MPLPAEFDAACMIRKRGMGDIVIVWVSRRMPDACDPNIRR